MTVGLPQSGGQPSIGADQAATVRDITQAADVVVVGKAGPRQTVRTISRLLAGWRSVRRCGFPWRGRRVLRIGGWRGPTGCRLARSTARRGSLAAAGCYRRDWLRTETKGTAALIWDGLVGAGRMRAS